MHTKQILITFYNITISLRNLTVSHLQKCFKMEGEIQLCMKPTFLEITVQEKRKYANLCTFKRTFVIKISLHLNSLKGFVFISCFLFSSFHLNKVKLFPFFNPNKMKNCCFDQWRVQRCLLKIKECIECKKRAVAKEKLTTT